MNRPPQSEVVITGVGVVSPIGIGRERFWTRLCEGKSGVGRIKLFDSSALPVRIGAEVDDFDPKLYVRPRKSLRIMARDTQLGLTAATLACRDANISAGAVDPERFGVILGVDKICTTLKDSIPPYRICLVENRFDFNRWGTEGLDGSFPLAFLKTLPNMVAAYVSIAHDARGPNNTIHHGEVSSLLAVSEAAHVIQRGAADVMIVGGASSQMHPFDCIRRCAMGILSRWPGDPSAAIRPFDAQRDGQVWGEGAAAFILENRHHAEARGTDILARLLGWAATCEPHSNGIGLKGTGLRRAIDLSLRRAGIDGARLGHINAHGLSTPEDDRLEARALNDLAPAVPVLAAKSYFGNLGAAAGAVEMAVSVLSMGAGLVPPTLNYERPDPHCPLPVIHGEPLPCSTSPALLVNWTSVGQAAALVLAGPD